MSANTKRGGGSERALLNRGLAGGVRREVRPEERATLAALKPDAQTQAVLDALPPAAVVAPALQDRTQAETPETAVNRGTPAQALQEPAGEGTSVSRAVELVAITAVAPSPHQARRHFGGIAELARSIADTGLQHPILVRRNAAGAPAAYTLVFGERRHRAYTQLAREAGTGTEHRFDHIPAFVLQPEELSDARLAVLTAEENAQRAGLTAWELAQNVVRLKAALEADADRPVRFDQLARHFNLQAGSTNEYYTIGVALPESLLREAGLVDGDEVDWPRVAQLKKQRLLVIARKPPAERVALLRAYAGVQRTARRRAGGARFSVEQLRAEGGFAIKIEKPVSNASYSRTQSESFLRDLEPALALLAEIAGDGAPVYHPSTPNLPGTYLVLRDRPDQLSPEERRQALEAVEALRRELTRR